jgi:hypothetical protein
LGNDCSGANPVNIDHQEGQHRADSGAPPAWASGAIITEYPLEHRRYDGSEHEPFWAPAEALDMPQSLHTATRRQGKIRGVGEKTLSDASSRATKAFYPALSMCDLIFSGVFERHPRLALAIVEFELAWAPYLLSTMDYTYRERHGKAIYRFKGGMLPSDFFRRNVFLSFQEDAIGIRLPRSFRFCHPKKAVRADPVAKRRNEPCHGRSSTCRRFPAFIRWMTG